MKILVCITHVPDTTAKITFTNDNTKFNEAGIQFIIGPYDDYALAKAVELKDTHGGSITVLNVGEASTEPTIRKALAIGADDAIRINANPMDSMYVAQQIAEIAKQEKYDLILMGRESIDYNNGIVHGIVGALLDMPSISPVMLLDIEGTTAKLAREIEGGKEFLEVELPFVAGCQEPIAEWKIPNMRGIMTARTKPLKVVEPVPFNPASGTVSYESLPEKGSVKLIDPENAEELIDLLKNEEKVL
ncbi:MAG: electron transfer flavoprotein subunit beta/FixA family protein [Cyclobacteriaceae bacterium]|nr:electron transfer flavoprotein subunit beta/FixA family protein [Cyclobacteriaceae bacterium]MCK5471413.1 electron transfer flavoprotein subunit beta/FixA family protein [Cyclobacteriaceae bacterium]